MKVLSLFHGPLGLLTIAWLVLILIVFLIAFVRFLSKSGRIIKDCDAVSFPLDESELDKTPLGRLLLENTRAGMTTFAEDSLNVSTVAAPYKLNLRVAQSIPSILTSLGILGTFIGLSFAVLNFDSTSSETIRVSINSLLSGMGTAFFTSVFGLLLSVIFLWLERSKKNALCNSIDSLLDRSDRAQRLSPAPSLDERLEEISGKISGLKLAFGDNLDKVFDEKVTPVMTEISKKLENPAQAVVDGLVLEFQNMTSSLADTLTKKVNNKMEELLEEFILATDALKGIPGAINSAVDAQRDVTASLSGQIDSLKTIEETYSSAIRQIASANSDLADAKSGIAALSSKISTVVQSIESVPSDLVESNDKVLANFETLYELNRNVTDQVKEYSERIKGIEGGLKGIFGEIDKGLVNYATTSSRNMQGLLDVFTNSVTDACQNIANATAPLNETILEIFKMLDKTEKSVQTLLKRVEGFSQQSK